MVIETVSLPESSAIAKARRTVPTGISTDSPPTVAGKAAIWSPFSLLTCLLLESTTAVIFQPVGRQSLKKCHTKLSKQLSSG